MTKSAATSNNLTNQLKVIAKKSIGNSASCPLGRIIRKLDEETRQALVEALRSEATTMDIAKALKSEGLAIARQNISKKRECFTSPSDKNCLCYPNNTETIT